MNSDDKTDIAAQFVWAPHLQAQITPNLAGTEGKWGKMFA
jgi:hypothetical protein